MSATEAGRREARLGGASWRDSARLADLARRHGLPAGLAIVVGALLRTLWLGDTSFLGDQAQLLALGRSAADYHALIITGIPSSISILNPPLSTWLYGLFALIGGPLGATLFTALANVLAIGLLYALATRYHSQRAGVIAALLYATASGPVHYARFIWQQNLLAPVVLLLFWSILLAVVERRSGWLGWAVLLWGAATELHPTAAPLLGLIAVALAFTWRDLRWRDGGWAALALLGLFGPTLLWEALSHGADLLGAQRLTQGHTIFDTWALTYLVQLMQPAPTTWYGAGTSYAAIGQALAPLGGLIEAGVIAAQIALVGALVAPWLGGRGWRLSARAALADTRWRSALSLVLWEALPIALMLRHSRPVEPHYLLVVLPAVYLLLGAFLASASEWLSERVSRRLSFASERQQLLTATLAGLLLIVGVTQAVGVSSELATIHSGRFDGLALPLHYGTPLSSERDALAATQAAARQLRATVAIAATRVQQEPLGYLNATDSISSAATDYISDGCLALPAASATSPLVTLVTPGTTAARLLPRIQGARALSAVAVKGGPPYQVFAITPGATLTDERPIAAPAQHGAPQPTAYAYTPATSAGSAALTIRWVSAPAIQRETPSAVSYWYGADPRGAPLANYTVTAQALGVDGQPLGAPLTSVCARFAWSPALSLITTTTLPTRLTTGATIAAWRVSAQVAPAVATRPTIGPLPLETGAITFGPAQPLGDPVTFAAPLA